MLQHFIKRLRDIFQQTMSVLDEHYVDDLLHGLSLDIEAELENFYEIRHGLYDPGRGELMTRTCFTREEAQAFKRHHDAYRDASVCLVLIERKQ